MAKTFKVPLILGTGSFGLEGAPGARLTSKTEGQEVVDLFVKAGGKTIDTAKLYCGETSQKLLAQLDVKDALIDTKIWPLEPGAHSPENLRAAVEACVEALAPHKINVLYLHAPDRSVPFADIAREINELHKRGLIREFGLSNFYAWEVAEFYYIADKNGWLRPTVYQGVYSVLERQVEAELFPALKKFGIRFYGYSPLAGSILAGKDLGVAAKDGSRFDPSSSGWIAQYYTGRYGVLVPGVQELRDEVAKHGLSLPQVAFRWLQHHSQFDASRGDGIIIGSYTLERLKQTLEWSEEGPLPAEVLKLVDDLYAKNKGLLWHYSGM
ncbi:Aldo/keto reductase [Mycena sanguinolenta]|uniref:Aldo/keto reductase n=1 Tax=Mycena sanguinolenta TaxID=230812 RepID=A0A8H6XGV6_9AGAR|nr:Aldo/keto reductase [Mycena sanguinolenta]